MAASIVATTSANSPSSDNAPTVTKPAGVGTVYVLAIFHSESHTVSAWPAGFTEIAESGSETTLGGRIRVATRTYTGTEGATFAATTSGFAWWFAHCALLDGVDAALVTSDSTGNSSGFGSTATLTGGSVTTGGTNRFVLWIGGSWSSGTTVPTSYTPPSGFTLNGSVYSPFDTTSNDASFVGLWTKTEPTDTTGAYSGSAAYSDSDSRDGLTATLVFAEIVTGQFLRPEADITAGTWVPSSGSDLYAMIDESAASEADYDSTPSPGTMEVRLSDAIDPAVSTGHIVRYRIKGSSDMVVTLLQGASTIATWTHAPVPSSYTTYEQTLSGGEAAAISDYTDLRLRFTAS